MPKWEELMARKASKRFEPPIGTYWRPCTFKAHVKKGVGSMVYSPAGVVMCPPPSTTASKAVCECGLAPS